MTVTVFDAWERRIWEGKADAYAGSFAKLCAYTVPRLLDAAGVGRGTRVLDAGTGPGTVAAAACARGAVVTAVDAEPSMVALAGQAAPGADVRHAVLPDLPFADGAFDAVVSNFVLNHVGRPAAVVTGLRRVTRPGGLLAVTIWTSPPAAGQALLGRSVEAAGVPRPDDVPDGLDPADDFPRTAAGLAGLLRDAGLADVGCVPVSWAHRTTPEEWWSGSAGGVARVGQILRGRPPEVVAAVRARFDLLSAEFAGPDGELLLPHTALLAYGTV